MHDDRRRALDRLEGGSPRRRDEQMVRTALIRRERDAPPANAAGRREPALVGRTVQRRTRCASHFRGGTLAPARIAAAGSAATRAYSGSS